MSQPYIEPLGVVVAMDNNRDITFRVIAASILLIFTHCVNAIADTPTRTENVFFISGKNYALTDSLLAKFRESWRSTSVPKVTTALTGSDRQWVFDFIAVDQGTRAPPCNNLVLVNIRSRPIKTDTLDGKTLTAGQFDEAWSVIACGKNLIYRAFVLANTSNLAVYEMNRNAPLPPDAIP